MVRTQIQLREDQSAGLRELARREGVSVAQMIRQAIDRLFEETGAACASGSRRDTLKVVGMFRSGLTDVGREHDRYLDEAYGAYGGE
jgi:hypothetical protein